MNDMQIIVLAITLATIAIITAMDYFTDRLTMSLSQIVAALKEPEPELEPDQYNDPELQGSWNDLHDALDAVDDNWCNINGLSLTEFVASLKAQRESIFGAREVVGGDKVQNWETRPVPAFDDCDMLPKGGLSKTERAGTFLPIDGYVRLSELEQYLNDAIEGSDMIAAKASLSLATRTKAEGRAGAFRDAAMDLAEGNIK